MGNASTNLPHFALSAATRLLGNVRLCRQASSTKEARRGGGYLYFTEPGGKRFPTISGHMLVNQGIVAPQGDGLLSGIDQSFSLTDDGAAVARRAMGW